MEKLDIKKLGIKGIGFAFDRCHKIYILEDEEDKQNMVELGYHVFSMKGLQSAWDNSCSLRFISNAKLDTRFVEQGQYSKY